MDTRMMALVLFTAAAGSACRATLPEGQQASAPLGVGAALGPVGLGPPRGAAAPVVIPTPGSDPCPVCKIYKLSNGEPCVDGVLAENPPSVTAADFPMQSMVGIGYDANGNYVQAVDLQIGNGSQGSTVKKKFTSTQVEKVYIQWTDAQSQVYTSEVLPKTVAACPY